MNIGIVGYGKMGKEVEKTAIEQSHNIIFIATCTNELNKNLKSKSIDVIIEFTTPKSAFQNIQTAINNNIPIVTGTTGWDEKLNEARNLCKEKNGSLIHASNFSIGVNLFFYLNRKLAHLMSNFSDYKASITEIHHKQKIDSPSGTAISLADSIISKNKNYKNWSSKYSKKSTNQLKIKSIRKNNAAGIHDVKYESPIDSISVNHTANSRKGFAIGALLAAQWIIGKKGIYTMNDVLNFN